MTFFLLKSESQIGIGLATQAPSSTILFVFKTRKSRIWSRKFLESPRTSRNLNRASILEIFKNRGLSFANRASRDCQVIFLCSVKCTLWVGQNFPHQKSPLLLKFISQQLNNQPKINYIYHKIYQVYLS